MRATWVHIVAPLRKVHPGPRLPAHSLHPPGAHHNPCTRIHTPCGPCVIAAPQYFGCCRPMLHPSYSWSPNTHEVSAAMATSDPGCGFGGGGDPEVAAAAAVSITMQEYDTEVEVAGARGGWSTTYWGKKEKKIILFLTFCTSPTLSPTRSGARGG